MKKSLKVKKHKEKNISISENLTGYQMSVLNEAREKFGFKNVWTYDGWILYKNNNDGQKIRIIMSRIYFEVLMVTIKTGKKLGCIFFVV